MRSVSDDARQLIIDRGFEPEWVFDLMYDGERRIANVPVTDVAPTWSGGQFVAGSATARVVWSDDHATSMIPKQIGDWFSPFGAEVQLDVILRAGRFAERIPQGRFLIESVGDAAESTMPFDGRLIHAGESFKINLKDTLLRVQRDTFPFPTAPRSTSVWEEIQSVTGLPVIQNLPDRTIPRTAYEGDRDAVLSRLFDMLDAWPHMTPSGAITARPKQWPAPVDEIRGVVSAPVTLTSDRTYNRVVVEGKDPDGEPIYAVAEVHDGFLRVRNPDGTASPFGGSTYQYSSEFLTTVEQCENYARSLLTRVSRIRGVTRDVTEPFNPLREVGDVLSFQGGVVRVREVSHTGATTHLVVEVPDD